MSHRRAPDRRVVRTQTMLRDALIALIHERGWDGVSVQDICARADVGRSTFYVHFADKEELLLSGFDLFSKQLRAHVAARAGEPLAFLRPLIEHVREHQQLYRALVGKRSHQAVRKEFMRVVLELVECRRRALDGLRSAAKRRSALPGRCADRVAGLVAGQPHWTRCRRDRACHAAAQPCGTECRSAQAGSPSLILAAARRRTSLSARCSMCAIEARRICDRPNPSRPTCLLAHRSKAPTALSGVRVALPDRADDVSRQCTAKEEHMALRITPIAFALSLGCAAGTNSGTQGENSDPPGTDQQDLGSAGGTASNDGCQVDHTVVKDERAPFIPDNDVDLIDALVPHHRMAIEMAEIEIAEGDHPEVIAMAENMRDVQTAEVAELTELREELTGCAEVPPLDDPHSRADLARLRDSRGEQLDRLFLEHMIPHHAGALEFTHNALPNLRSEELRTMALRIIEAQSAEIGEMHALEMKLGSAGHQMAGR